MDKGVTVNREFDEDGQLPEGREVHFNDDHPIEVPVDLEGENLDLPEGDGKHGRKLGSWSCYNCWYDPYYGWISYCCHSYYGCKYVYC